MGRLFTSYMYCPLSNSPLVHFCTISHLLNQCIVYFDFDLKSEEGAKDMLTKLRCLNSSIDLFCIVNSFSKKFKQKM